jgi:sugar O-acyltransferase (sialic acid O-acetyltransferase NeuD family)
LKSKTVLVGGFNEIIELCEICGAEIIGIIDSKIKNKYMGYKIFGGDEIAKDIYKKYPTAKIIISPDLPKIREKLFHYYSSIGFTFRSLISPNAIISRNVNIGSGVVIQTGVNISSNVRIGNFVKLNTMSNIMHNTEVGNFTTIAPNAVVLGNVDIGEKCYIGANATLLPNKKIGSNVTIGAGAVLTKTVGNDQTLAGNPAKKMIKND